MSLPKPIWIKVCANTSLEDARLASDCGADAAGFVFAPSPRQVTAAQVAAITAHLPPGIEKIGVFVDASFAEICATVDACALTGVQLHSDFAPEIRVQLRQRFGRSLRIIQVVHFGADAASHASALAGDPNIDAILVDSRTVAAPGGTGLTFDWDLAGMTLFKNAADRRFVAAGGLTPGNVAEAIARLHPWGVDVASGVEASPGRKDPEKVRQFIRAAQSAGAP